MKGRQYLLYKALSQYVTKDISEQFIGKQIQKVSTHEKMLKLTRLSGKCKLNCNKISLSAHQAGRERGGREKQLLLLETGKKDHGPPMLLGACELL